MLSIGEFSKICKVSTKTLRYYAEIGLILPSDINPENGYRYYSIKQLEVMLFIDRLKSYNLSLEEIKMILEPDGPLEEKLFMTLTSKKHEIELQAQAFTKTLDQLQTDIDNVKQGISIMTYLKDIDVQMVEVDKMNILSFRKMIHKFEFAEAYAYQFHKLFKKINDDNLTILAPPMVLFHSAEFSPFGMDSEFAIPIKECVTGSRDFHPGLCLKTVLHGSYTNLTSVYAKQLKFAEKEGYESRDALFEVYCNDPSDTIDESNLVTEVYYPIKKKATTI